MIKSVWSSWDQSTVFSPNRGLSSKSESAKNSRNGSSSTSTSRNNPPKWMSSFSTTAIIAILPWLLISNSWKLCWDIGAAEKPSTTNRSKKSYSCRIKETAPSRLSPTPNRSTRANLRKHCSNYLRNCNQLGTHSWMILMQPYGICWLLWTLKVLRRKPERPVRWGSFSKNLQNRIKKGNIYAQTLRIWVVVLRWRNKEGKILINLTRIRRIDLQVAKKRWILLLASKKSIQKPQKRH